MLDSKELQGKKGTYYAYTYSNGVEEPLLKGIQPLIKDKEIYSVNVEHMFSNNQGALTVFTNKLLNYDVTEESSNTGKFIIPKITSPEGTDVYENGEVIAGVLNNEKSKVLNTYDLMKNGVNSGGFNIDNTTIGIVATNAKLTKAECKKISQMSHNGYAKAIFPIHTPHDGDTIFTIATGEVESDVTLLGSIATEVIEKSIINAIKNAKSIDNIPSYEEINLK